MAERLEGKVALVTGAGAGIGEATAANMPQELSKEWMDRVAREVPMGGKMDEPLDIANGCLFLASEESKYMTGSELVIDGGYTCR